MCDLSSGGDSTRFSSPRPSAQKFSDFAKGNLSGAGGLHRIRRLARRFFRTKPFAKTADVKHHSTKELCQINGACSQQSSTKSRSRSPDRCERGLQTSRVYSHISGAEFADTQISPWSSQTPRFHPGTGNFHQTLPAAAGSAGWITPLPARFAGSSTSSARNGCPQIAGVNSHRRHIDGTPATPRKSCHLCPLCHL